MRKALGQPRRLHGIRLQRRDDVDPVERRQVIEVHDVVVHGVRGQDQVPDVLRIQRHLQFQRVLDRADRRDRVHRRAHAAEPLREEPRLSRIASLENPLDAAEHRPRRPRLSHDSPVHLGVDTEMPLDAGHRVDGDTRHECFSIVMIGNSLTMTM